MHSDESTIQQHKHSSDSCCNSSRPRMDLTEKQSVAKLQYLDSWCLLEEKSIRKLWKTYRIPFKQSTLLIEQLGQICEQFNHHPEVELNYNSLTIKWHTNSAGGLTDLDFASAEACDAIVDTLLTQTE